MAEKIKNAAVVLAAALFVFVFFAWNLLKPAQAESLSERRPLAQLPAADAEAVLSGDFMENFETYALDQFPLRDGFRAVKACVSLYALGQGDNNGIYVQDGYAAKLDYPMDTASIDYAAGRFQYVYDRYLAGRESGVFFALIPDKNFFMAEENGYPAIDYEAFAARIREKTPFAEFIDLAPALELSDYYRTDTHWRQEKITDVAQLLAERMGTSIPGEYTVQRVEAPFYGVYSGQSALPLQPDTLCYLETPALESCTVYDYETGETIPVYALEKAGGRDPYELFLSGSKSLLTIENPRATTDRALILFRDSFGSSLAPLLVDGYAKITLVDIRYISPALLDRFIAFDDQDVLFLYSVSILNSSETIK